MRGIVFQILRTPGCLLKLDIYCTSPPCALRYVCLVDNVKIIGACTCVLMAPDEQQAAMNCWSTAALAGGHLHQHGSPSARGHSGPGQPAGIQFRPGGLGFWQQW